MKHFDKIQRFYKERHGVKGMVNTKCSTQIKKSIVIIMIMFTMIILTGCSAADKPKEETEKHFQYYYVYSGSSSVSEEYIVYTHEENLIFLSHYFNCGEETAETFLLDEEQKKLFYEKLEGISIKEKLKGNEEADGGASEKGVCGFSDGTCIYMEILKPEDFHVEFKDIYEIEFPDKEEYGLSITGLYEVWEASAQERPIGINADAFETLIKGQIVKTLGEDVKSAEVTDSEKSEENSTFEIEVTDGNEEKYRASVNSMGYVISMEKIL